MSAVLVNFLGAVAIVLIIWWFWFSKPKLRRAESSTIEIIVDNGVYDPARIEVPVNSPVVLNFLRKDPSPCAEQVVFADLGISVDLALNTITSVTLVPDKRGEFAFTCQMQMYRGSLVVT